MANTFEPIQFTMLWACLEDYGQPAQVRNFTIAEKKRRWPYLEILRPTEASERCKIHLDGIALFIPRRDSSSTQSLPRIRKH